MRQAVRIAAAIFLWTICGAIPGFAQTPPGDGWVVLSIEEYQSLRDRSLGLATRPSPATPAVAGNQPVAATLSRVDYDLRLDGEAVAGRAMLAIDLLRDGWARIPIPPGLAVGDARIDGE